MSKKLKMQIGVVIVGLFGSVTAFFLDYFARYIGFDISHQNNANELLFMKAILPMLIAVASSQIAYHFRAEADKSEIIKEVRGAIPNSIAIKEFDNYTESMKYLISNVSTARACYNTRFALKDSRYLDFDDAHLVEELDSSIESSLMKGMKYHWLVSDKFVNNAKSLINKRNVKNRSRIKRGFVGTCDCWCIDNNTIPLFHFCIIKYSGYSEVVFGWAISEERDFSEKVYLVKDERIVDWFYSLFVSYSRGAVRIEGSV